MAIKLTYYYLLPIVGIILRFTFLAGYVLSNNMCLLFIMGSVDSGDNVFVFEVRRASVGIAAFFGYHLLLALH